MKQLLINKPYGNERLVEKIECRNHLLRNLCSKLRAIGSNTCFPVTLRKHLEANILRFRTGIKKATKHWKDANDVTEPQKFSNLSQDVLNSYKHVFGFHGSCRFVKF